MLIYNLYLKIKKGGNTVFIQYILIMNELIIKKCNHCGEIVKVIKNGGCEINCCGEPMKTMIPNSVDAAAEKHVPTFEIKDNMIYVTVNHVMEEDHYIEWISIENDKKTCTTYFKPGDIAKTHFKNIPGSTIYAYCNQHGLWKKEI